MLIGKKAKAWEEPLDARGGKAPAAPGSAGSAGGGTYAAGPGRRGGGTAGIGPEPVAAGGPDKPSGRMAADPSKITQSYYAGPTGGGGYESGRPVYAQSQAVRDAAAALAAKEGERPGPYESAYGDQIQSLIDQMLNRPKFQYDFTQDPLYRQYADRYQRGGQIAMRDAMGQSAALTGGYGNSYAQQAGQQTYQRYLERMNAVIPELRDAAYRMYEAEGGGLRANLGMLQGQDDREYGRYRDSVSDYQNELDYFYSRYGDMSDREYQIYLNDRDAWETDRAYWYQKRRDEAEDGRWQAEFNAKYGGGGGGGGGGRSRKKKAGAGAEAIAPGNKSAIGSTAASVAAVKAWREKNRK